MESAICENCRKPFTSKRHYRPLRFCGRVCASLAREAAKRAQRKHQKCEQCGKDFWQPIGKRLRNRRFCSKSCVGKWVSKNRHSPEAAIRARVAKTCCDLIARTLRHTGKRKSDKLVQLLGYSPADLKAHLERQFTEGMSWENYGRHGWHVDHIRPISTFPKDASVKEINALSNLRPLWESENCGRRAQRGELSMLVSPKPAGLLI